MPNFETFIRKCLKDKTSYQDSYKKFKFKNSIYNIGDAILVKNDGDPLNDFVGKLLRILRPKKMDSNKIVAFLEV